MNIKRLKVLTASLFVIQAVLFVNPVYASPSFIDHPIEALKDFLNSYGFGDNNTDSTESTDSIESISGENNNVTVAQSEATEAAADDDAVISATLQEILKKQNSSTMILNAEQPNEEELTLSTVEAPDIMAEDVSFRDGEDLNKEQEEIREMAYIYADTDYDDDAIREANLPWYSKEYIADSMAYIEDALGVDMGGLGAVTAMASGAFASVLGTMGIVKKKEEDEYEDYEEDYAPSGFMTTYNRTASIISHSSIPLMAFGFGADSTQQSITDYIESISDMYNLTDARELASNIYNVAKNYNVDPFILTSLFGQESGFNPFAVSEAGAQGIAQFMPETAESLGVDTTSVMSSIDGAARYLSSLLQSYGNYEQALAAYNAGPGNVDEAKEMGLLIPNFKETQAYVTNILNTASTLIATSASYMDKG